MQLIAGFSLKVAQQLIVLHFEMKNMTENYLDRIYEFAISKEKVFNMKPKKSAEFEYKYDSTIEPKFKDYHGVRYIMLPCKILKLDNKVVGGHKHTIQLSMQRDYSAFYDKIIQYDNYISNKYNIKLLIKSTRLSVCKVSLLED